MSEYMCPAKRVTTVYSQHVTEHLTGEPLKMPYPRLHQDDQTICHPVLCALHRLITQHEPVTIRPHNVQSLLMHLDDIIQGKWS